jgi:hypothetical protein
MREINERAVAEFSVPNALLSGAQRLLNIAATADIALGQLLSSYSNNSPHSHTCSGLRT